MSNWTEVMEVVDKLRMLKMVMKDGKEFQKVPNNDRKQKCNFLKQGFCKKADSLCLCSPSEDV